MEGIAFEGTERTSLYEMETPGNFVEFTIDRPSGVGGKDAADA